MIELVRTDANSADFQALVMLLDGQLAKVNGDANDFFAQFNQLSAIRHVVIAYENEQALACGAIKKYDDNTMEIKRMYTHENARRKGLASLILGELEAWARQLGYKKCILETSCEMLDAVALYQKNNYLPIPKYGQYADVETSACFEKVL